jgi:uncharacterized protein YoxC
MQIDWLTVFVGIIAISNLILLTVLVALCFTVKRVINNAVKPAMDQLKTTVSDVDNMVKNIDSRTVAIMNITKDTADNVSSHIKKTTILVSEIVNPPLINIAGISAGIFKAISSLKSDKKK